MLSLVWHFHPFDVLDRVLPGRHVPVLRGPPDDHPRGLEQLVLEVPAADLKHLARKDAIAAFEIDRPAIGREQISRVVRDWDRLLPLLLGDLLLQVRRSRLKCVLLCLCLVLHALLDPALPAEAVQRVEALDIERGALSLAARLPGLRVHDCLTVDFLKWDRYSFLNSEHILADASVERLAHPLVCDGVNREDVWRLAIDLHRMLPRWRRYLFGHDEVSCAGGRRPRLLVIVVLNADGE